MENIVDFLTSKRYYTILSVILFLAFFSVFSATAQIKNSNDYTVKNRVYSWINISKTGTKISDWKNGYEDPISARDDGYTSSPIPLGWDFDFYGVKYNSIYVGCNGLISFTQKALNSAARFGSTSEDSIGYYDDIYTWPGNSLFPNSIAIAFNDFDLCPNDGFGHGDVYYKTINDQFILTWEKVGVVDSEGDTLNTFQMILDKTANSIILQYQYFGSIDTRKSLKIGIQKDSATGLGWIDMGIPAARIPANETALIFSPSGSNSAPDYQDIPKDFLLCQNYPNPFNSSTIINYQLPINGFVSIKVYDVLGKEVATLVSVQQPAGSYSTRWNASNAPGGIYYYKLAVNNKLISIQKMVLLK
jgi:hypothetical protein